MGYNDRCAIDTLIGETLTHIDVDSALDQILLTTESGRIIKVYHDQDCCEGVSICGTDGDWNTLLGKVIVDAEHTENPQGLPEPEYPDSWTRTDLKFQVNDATVISRWIGESNGYYSESVDIEDVTSKYGK